MQYSATLIAIMLCLVCIHDSLRYCIVKLCEFLFWWGDPLSCEWVNWASGLMCQKLVSQCLSTASVNMNECKLYYKLQTKYILNPQLSCKVTWSGLYIYVPSYPLFQHWNKDTTVWNSWYWLYHVLQVNVCTQTPFFVPPLRLLQLSCESPLTSPSLWGVTPSIHHNLCLHHFSHPHLINFLVPFKSIQQLEQCIWTWTLAFGFEAQCGSDPIIASFQIAMFAAVPMTSLLCSFTGVKLHICDEGHCPDKSGLHISPANIPPAWLSDIIEWNAWCINISCLTIMNNWTTAHIHTPDHIVLLSRWMVLGLLSGLNWWKNNTHFMHQHTCLAM